jgi:hypothetical protein
MSTTNSSSQSSDCNTPDWGSITLSKEVISEQGNKIRLVDSDPDNKLDLFCYVRCVDNSDPKVKSCRGVVTLNDKVLYQTYGYTHEYTTESLETIKQTMDFDSNFVVQDAHEGSLLRVFCVNETWYVTTHRKLDAFRSKWASRQSFGAQFVESLVATYDNDTDFKEKIDSVSDEDIATTRVFTLRSSEHDKNPVLLKFLYTLDKSKCYCFLVRNTSENRIVCQSPETPILYHSGTFSESTSEFLGLGSDLGVPVPDTHSFSSWEEVCAYVDEKTDHETLQGLIVFNGRDHIKILNSNYKRYFEVRGNEPSIRYRYLQVRMNKEMTDSLYELYPRYTDQFQNYENMLYAFAKVIYDSYVKRFIKRQFVTLPKEEYTIMRACHAWHLEDRSKNRMNLRKVIEKMNEQPPTILNKMIRRKMQEAIEEKKKLSEGVSSKSQEVSESVPIDTSE